CEELPWPVRVRRDPRDSIGWVSKSALRTKAQRRSRVVERDQIATPPEIAVREGAGTSLSRRFRFASATRRHFLQHLDTMGNCPHDKAETFHRAAGLAWQTDQQRLIHHRREIARQDGVLGDLHRL